MTHPWSASETALAIRLRMQGRTFAEVREKLIENRCRPRSVVSIGDRFDRCATASQKTVSEIIKGINMSRGRGVPIEVRRGWAHQARAAVQQETTP
jgi:metallophosphoesterase superfamily enzyme